MFEAGDAGLEHTSGAISSLQGGEKSVESVDNPR